MTGSAKTLRLGTRGSALALAQSGWVAAELQRLHPQITVETVIIRTVADRSPNLPLSAIGDKALWVVDLEQQLLNGQIDLAVHSMKDLPAELPEGLCIGAVPEREWPMDALVLPVTDGSIARTIPNPPSLRVGLDEVGDGDGASSEAMSDLLPQGARVGTSSARRENELLHWRPDLQILPVRGNVDTRLRKLDEGEWDALVLAAAGLRRLGRGDRISALFPPGLMLPSAGQGALAIEIRSDDEIRSLLDPLNHAPSAAAVEAERSFVRAVGGGCSVPLGAYAEFLGDTLELTVRAIDTRGPSSVLEIREQTPLPAIPASNLQWAFILGQRAATRFLQSGGAGLIARLKSGASQ